MNGAALRMILFFGVLVYFVQFLHRFIVVNGIAFTYLASCSANGLVHRRLGVFCMVFAPVYWGKRSILRRHT